MTLLERALAILGKNKKTKRTGVKDAKRALATRTNRIDNAVAQALGKKTKKKQKIATPITK
jgi:hypothetical protein